MAELTEKQEYNLKKVLRQLESLKGRHTELISLYIPPEKQISEVTQYLKEEYSQSSNIKSKTTRKNVTSAISSIISRLKAFKQIPENGLVFFIGAIAKGQDDYEMVTNVIEPSKPVTIYAYRCNSEFFLGPLKEQLKKKDVYGLMLIDRRECTIGELEGGDISLIDYMSSRVPGKHGRGGQSQHRFERLIEIAAHEWFEKCGVRASEIFLEPRIKGVIVGGPGPTKEDFLKGNYLDYQVQQKVIGTFDTGYTDEYGLRELVNVAGKSIEELGISKQKREMDRFMKELRKEGGMALYGISAIRDALAEGKVDTLLISEGYLSYKVSLKCNQCGARIDATVKGEEDIPKNCSKCNAQNSMEVLDWRDTVDEFVDIAEGTGTRIIFISPSIEEGDALLNTFGGIAAILRYR
jgi:peptide chain release factor subunit 1